MRGTAAIIGGGIGGLAAARALHDDGWRVTVFEREPGLSGAGTALGMWPSALAALDRVGVGAAVRATGTPQRTARFLRPDGSPIGELDATGLVRRTGDPVRLISRPALLDLLLAAAPPGIRFGTVVDEPVELSGCHDVVVAADGIFSRTRATLFGDAYRARYTGITAWRGWIDHRPTEDLTETWGAGHKFGVTPQEGGRTNWYATAVAPPQDFTPGDELARLKDIFGSWRGPVAEVLAAVTEDGILRHDIHVVPRLPAYVSGTVALIGDAAHAMAPDLGRGACEALIDAVALADRLRAAPSVVAGLAGYDRERRRRTQRLARMAAGAARMTRWTRALGPRDALLGLSLRVPPPP